MIRINVFNKIRVNLILPFIPQKALSMLIIPKKRGKNAFISQRESKKELYQLEEL